MSAEFFCANCPLRGEGSALKVHENEAVTYITDYQQGCGPNFVQAKGAGLEQIKQSAKECKGPDVAEDKNFTKWLTKLGFDSTVVVADCPAALRHFDDKSPARVREFIEGDKNGS